MLKVKHFIEQSWLLIVASFIFGLLVAVTYASWKPRIDQNEKDKLNNLMRFMITDANSFEIAVRDAEINTGKGKILKTNIYKALYTDGRTLGYAFVAVGSGFADKIKLVIATDIHCEKVFGFKVLASNETPGFGSKITEDFYTNQFKGAPATELIVSKTGDPEIIDDKIITISGATVSSEAVVKIFNTFIAQIKQKLEEQGLI
ncbi:MAG: FMN-binding protein [Planctomycetes bacterium]|nr:FMN-binding protein [Planctomycetota bacterium]